MDWHAPLITLYLAVCHHWQEGGWAQAQRHAPYADLDFTDEEVSRFTCSPSPWNKSVRSRIFTGMLGAIGGTGSPGCPAMEPTCSA